MKTHPVIDRIVLRAGARAFGLAGLVLGAILLGTLGVAAMPDDHGSPSARSRTVSRGLRVSAPMTGTPTITVTPGITLTPTITVTPSITVTPPLTTTPTATVTITATAPVTVTPPITSTPEITMTPVITSTPGITLTPTITVTPPISGTPTIGPSPTPTDLPPPTPSATGDPDPVPTRTPLPPEISLPFGANTYFYTNDDVVSGIQIQNLDRSQSAMTRATLYRSNGDAALTINKDAAPGGAPNIYLPSHRSLDGLLPGLYSLRITADRPIGSIVRTDWSRSKGSAIYSYVNPGSDVVVPGFVRKTGDRYSLVSIQNAGDAPAEVRAELYTGLATPMRRAELGPFRIAPGAALRLHANLDAAFQGLGDFDGWLRVTSEDGTVAVQTYVLTEVAGRAIQPVYGFEGMPASMAASELLVPLFRSSQRVFTAGNRADTSILVVNPGETAAGVTVRYFGSRDNQASTACRGASFNHGKVTVPAKGSTVIEQRQGAGHGLPPDCFGSAVITTDAPDQRVLATVLDQTNTDQLLSAYDAVPAGAPGLEVALPLFRREHFNLTTGIQVMNAGDAPARVAIAFSATDAATDRSTPITGCDSCVQTIAARESYTWWPPLISAIRPNTFGSAVVVSDQPVIVLVVDYPMQGQVDPAAYLGITTQ